MRTRLALLVAVCFFMENLDGTIVTTAVPRLAVDLGVGVGAVGVIITSYLLALAVVIPVGGWLMTRMRARTIFVAAIALFTLASLGCGFADDLGWLTVFRVMQGVGGALMVPVGRQLVLRDAPKEEVLRMISYIVWPGLLAPVVAPLVGGVILTTIGWRWMFWINVPLGIIALVIAVRLVPATIDETRRRFDLLGFVLLGLGLGGLTWGAHLVADGESTLVVAGLVCAAGVALCGLAAVHLLRASQPLVDLSVLRDRVFGLSQLGTSAFFMLVAAVPFLLPLQLQTAFGWDPVAAGALVMCVFVGNIGIKPATTRLLRTFGFRANLFVATVGLVVTVVLLGVSTSATSPVLIGLIALASGVFRSVALTAYSSIGFSTISLEQRGGANTVQAVVQQLSTGLGVGVAAVLLRAAQSITGQHAAQATYLWAFALVAVVGLVSVVSMAFFPRAAGRELSAARA